MIKKEDMEHVLTKHLETLVDGIFAISMTLLVKGLVVPQITGPLSNTVVQNSYYNLLPNLFALVLSFLLLAILWNSHHRIFNHIEEINDTLLWINVIWLLFIILVPFSASSLGQYGNYILPNVIFNINMLGIGILLYINTHYALKMNFIKEETTKFRYRRYANIGFIFISLLALLLSFTFTSWSPVAYILILPLTLVTRK
jgi:uncharacterized membrane protein